MASPLTSTTTTTAAVWSQRTGRDGLMWWWWWWRWCHDCVNGMWSRWLSSFVDDTLLTRTFWDDENDDNICGLSLLPGNCNDDDDDNSDGRWHLSTLSIVRPTPLMSTSDRRCHVGDTHSPPSLSSSLLSWQWWLSASLTTVDVSRRCRNWHLHNVTSSSA